MLEPSIGRRSFFFYSLAYYGIVALTVIMGATGLHLFVLPVFCIVRYDPDSMTWGMVASGLF